MPEGEPGEFDLTEEDERFGMFVAAFGGSTAVADFGSGSELTGPCGGHAFSYDRDGVLLDAAVGLRLVRRQNACMRHLRPLHQPINGL